MLYHLPGMWIHTAGAPVGGLLYQKGPLQTPILNTTNVTAAVYYIHRYSPWDVVQLDSTEHTRVQKVVTNLK